MKLRCLLGLLLWLGVALVRVPAQVVIQVHSFPAAQWGVSDTTLGVAGYVVEDFEDVNLVAGLLIGWNTAAGNVSPANTIPFTFNPVTDDPFGTAFTQGGTGAWDGTRGLINTRTNQSYDYNLVANWGDIVIQFTTPVTSVGFSLQQNDYDVGLVINGTDFGGLQSYTSIAANGARYAYIRIDATSGSISSLTLVNGKLAFNDGLMIDHLAFAPVPEPAIYLLLPLGLIALRVAHRRLRS